MLLRLTLLLCLSALTACSSILEPRQVPAPVVELRGQPSDAGPGAGPGPDSGPAPALAPGKATSSAPLARQPLPESQPSDAWSSSPAGKQAEEAFASGNSELAAALIERELAIKPRDAFLWLQLSKVKAQQNQLEEAQGMAQRALSLSRTMAMQDAANEQLQVLQRMLAR